MAPPPAPEPSGSSCRRWVLAGGGARAQVGLQGADRNLVHEVGLCWGAGLTPSAHRPRSCSTPLPSCWKIQLPLSASVRPTRAKTDLDMHKPWAPVTRVS